MKVMHVVYALRPGGMELGVVKLVNGLDPARVQSAICSTQPAGELAHLLRPEVRLFELARREGNDPRLVLALFRLFRQQSPDVVHTHAWGTLVEGLIAARLAGVPAIVHGEHGTLQLRAYQRWAQRQAWRAAHRVLAVSSRLAERMSAETGFPLDRIRTIRNGVDLSRFGRVDRKVARQQLELPPDATIAATVGRLVPVKDHALLLESWSQLRSRGGVATLIIAGDGPLRSALEARAAAFGLSPQVRFLGHRPDVETVLAAADLFVLSSASEGLSNTILEAMASGLPVVATRVGGADEMVIDEETGLLVPPGAPEALAGALAALVADSAGRRRMGAAGRARAEAEFGLAAMLRQYEQIYEDVTRGRRAGAGRAAGRQPQSGAA